MKVSELIGTVVETVIKIIVVVTIVMVIFKSSTKAYDFGYRVFSDIPVSESEEGRIITVGIVQDAEVKDIAQMLQEKGLISDAKLFVVQELLSKYHGDILPGIYDLNTNMRAEEMLETICTPTQEEVFTNDTADTEAEGEDTSEEGGTVGDAAEAESNEQENTESMGSEE